MNQQVLALSGFPLSEKSGNVGELCFDWNVRELSGDFAVCQGIFVVICHLCGCLFTEIIINVFLSLSLLIALFLVILLCWTCIGKQDHYDLRG